MKKFISLLLILAMVLGSVGTCFAGNGNGGGNEKSAVGTVTLDPTSQTVDNSKDQTVEFSTNDNNGEFLWKNGESFAHKVTGNKPATLSITIPKGTAAGTYKFTYGGTEGTITVTDTGSSGSTVTINPTTATVSNATDQTVTFTAANYKNNTDFAWVGTAPTGASVVTPKNDNAALKITIKAGTTAGTYAFTYGDASGSITVTNHEHTWAYSAEDNVITATCSGCSTALKATLSANSADYSGQAYNGASVTLDNGFPVKLDESDIVYYLAGNDGTTMTGTDDGAAASGFAPSQPGDYLAKLTVTINNSYVTAVKAFEIVDTSKDAAVSSISAQDTSIISDEGGPTKVTASLTGVKKNTSLAFAWKDATPEGITVGTIPSIDKGSKSAEIEFTVAKDTDPGTYSFTLSLKNKKGEILEGSSCEGSIVVQHRHVFTYDADGATITATCQYPGCDHTISATLTANSNTKQYNGEAFAPYIISNETNFENETGKALDITYYKVNSGVVTTYSELSEAPKNAGSYLATMKVDTWINKYASASFAITKANQPALAVVMSGYTFDDGNTHTPSLNANPYECETSDISYYYYAANQEATAATKWTSTTAANLLPGTYYVFAAIAEIENYNGYTTAAASFAVSPATLGEVTAESYEVDYDGKSHGPSVTCTTNDVTILYGEEADEINKASLSYEEAGEYTVFYSVSKTGYSTKTGYLVITINPDIKTFTTEMTANLSRTHKDVTTIKLPAIPAGTHFDKISCDNNNLFSGGKKIEDGVLTLKSGSNDEITSKATITIDVRLDKKNDKKNNKEKNNKEEANLLEALFEAPTKGNDKDLVYILTIHVTFKDVLNIIADSVDSRYGQTGNGYKGYANVSIVDPEAEKSLTVTENELDELVDDLVVKYYSYYATGWHNTTEEHDGAATINGCPKYAGTYKAELSIPDSNDYYYGKAEIEFEIKPAPLTVRAKDIITYVGADIPDAQSAGYTVTGLLNGDKMVCGPTLTYAETPDMSKRGSVSIIPRDANAGRNYDITYQPGTLYIGIDPTDIFLGAAVVGGIFHATPSSVPANVVEILNFVDVLPNTWYYNGVKFCYDNGLMKGVEENVFGLMEKTTRPMMTTILARMDGCDTEGGNTWYEIGNAWAKTNGINDGIPETGVITREEFATMLYRYAQMNGDGFTGSWMFLLDYKDANKVSGFANEAMHWCVMKGIIKGREDGTLDPQGELTRAEAATMIERFVNR